MPSWSFRSTLKHICSLSTRIQGSSGEPAQVTAQGAANKPHLIGNTGSAAGTRGGDASSRHFWAPEGRLGRKGSDDPSASFVQGRAAEPSSPSSCLHDVDPRTKAWSSLDSHLGKPKPAPLPQPSPPGPGPLPSPPQPLDQALLCPSQGGAQRTGRDFPGARGQARAEPRLAPGIGWGCCPQDGAASPPDAHT